MKKDDIKIIDHTHPEYIKARNRIGKGKYNGAFYYSTEIVSNIIPHINTDREWITIDIDGLYTNIPVDFERPIVFVHNRCHPEWYEKYKNCKDPILVCSVKDMCKKLEHIGKTIYLPLSVDVKYVQKFTRPKDKEVAYVGRKGKLREIPGCKIPGGVPFVYGVPRYQFLAEIARYKKVYAVDRAAIEAKILGCKILPYEPTYPDPSVWKILDNEDAARLLQTKLNEIDK